MSTEARPSKNQRREEARVQAERLREEQQRRARRQRTIALSLLGVGLVVVTVVVVTILSKASKSSDFTDVEQPLAEVSAPAGATDDGGLIVGQDGLPGLTDVPADAVEVTVYADYMCPICNQFEQVNGPLLDQLRESGDIVVEYHPVAILDRASQGTQYSTRSAAAAALVADQAPEAFVAFNEQLFANQPAEQTAGLPDEKIAEIARGAGVPDEVAATIDDGSYREGDDSFTRWVGAATEVASRTFAPQFGTPTILIDGKNLAKTDVDWRVEGALADAIAQARG